MSVRPKGFTLMEACAAMSLLGLFIAVFVALSSRLATAQSQQAARAAALGHLESCVQQVKQQGPRRWKLPLSSDFQEQATKFHVEIKERPDPLVTDHSFGRLTARVTWNAITGPQSIEREVWVHEHLQ